MREFVSIGVLIVLAAVSAQGGTAVVIEIGSGVAAPGEEVSVDIVLRTGGHDVVGTENTILFDGDAQIVSCERNEAIGQEATGFNLGPFGCVAGVDCTGVKTLVLSFSNLSSIPDGSVLYSCTVRVAPDASADRFPLFCDEPGASDPVGNQLPTECSSGEVRSSGIVAPTASGTPNASPTLAPPSTRTPTARPTATPAPFGDGTLVYSCRVGVAADAPPGSYPLRCSGLGVSDAAGNSVTGIGCVDGAVHLPPGAPTIVTLGSSDGAATRIRISSTAAAPGTAVDVFVVIDHGAQPVVGLENVIEFEPEARILAKPSGGPDCIVDPGIGREASAFSFTPSGCSGSECSGVKALILSFSNLGCIGPCSVAAPTRAPTMTPTVVTPDRFPGEDDGCRVVRAEGASPGWLLLGILLFGVRKMAGPRSNGFSRACGRRTVS